MVDQLLDPSSPPQWGLRLTFHEGWYQPRDRLPEGCPAWTNPGQQRGWRAEGLEIWNDATHDLEVLEAWEIVALLEQLRDTDAWKTAGDRIAKRITVLHLHETQVTAAGRRPTQAADSKPDRQTKKSDARVIDHEIVRLIPDACQAVSKFLQRNEKTIREMARIEEAERQLALARVYRFIFRSYRDHEIEETPLCGRALPWAHGTEKNCLVCDPPPDRATIVLSEGPYPIWFAGIERPHQTRHQSAGFDKLTEALDWAEKELATPPSLPAAVEEEGETFPPSTLDLRPYEIALEPFRVTYRPFIELERKPVRHKVAAVPLAEPLICDQEFPPATELAHELRLDAEASELNRLSKEQAGTGFTP